jgi:hypothetical protein
MWRVLLQSPLIDERLGFASLKDWFAFLEAQIGEHLPHSEDNPGEAWRKGGEFADFVYAENAPCGQKAKAVFSWWPFLLNDNEPPHTTVLQPKRSKPR